MNKENLQLKEKAQEGKALFLSGTISKKEALEYMNPYIKKYNEVAKEKGLKYNVKPKLVSFSNLIRSTYF